MAEKPPYEYFQTVFIQCETKEPKLGNITDIEILKENLRVNCIPENIAEMDAAHYEGFEFHCNLYFGFLNTEMV